MGISGILKRFRTKVGVSNSISSEKFVRFAELLRQNWGLVLRYRDQVAKDTKIDNVGGDRLVCG